MNISLAPESLFTIFGISISNTVFTAFLNLIIIITLILLIRFTLKYKNPSKLQQIFEIFVEMVQGMVYEALGKDKGKKMLGFLFSLFFFILITNLLGLVQLIPSVSIEHHPESHYTEEHADEPNHANSYTNNHSEDEEKNTHEEKKSLFACLKTSHCYLTINGIREFHNSVHVLRAPTSDLSLTLALAIISVVFTNIMGLRYLGFAYITKFLNFSNPIQFFVGLLEIVSEFGKLLSFSFRLFGNIFGGEVLLAIITSITFGLATLPFLLLEIFVGAIQAFVFFTLTTIFTSLAVTPHDENH